MFDIKSPLSNSLFYEHFNQWFDKDVVVERMAKMREAKNYYLSREDIKKKENARKKNKAAKLARRRNRK